MCNCFTVKVLVSNFKVEKSENLDNAIAFYVFKFIVFKRFFDMTLQINVTRSQAVARIADRTAKNCNSIAHMPFPIGGPLEPSLYL